jgi:hypothetical protein
LTSSTIEIAMHTTTTAERDVVDRLLRAREHVARVRILEARVDEMCPVGRPDEQHVDERHADEQGADGPADAHLAVVERKEQEERGHEARARVHDLDGHEDLARVLRRDFEERARHIEQDREEAEHEDVLLLAAAAHDRRGEQEHRDNDAREISDNENRVDVERHRTPFLE